MARTNIDIDEELIQRVMDLHGYRTKREAVEGALRRMDVKPYTREQILALQGTGWDGDLDEMRREPPVKMIWPDEEDAR